MDYKNPPSHLALKISHQLWIMENAQLACLHTGMAPRRTSAEFLRAR